MSSLKGYIVDNNKVVLLQYGYTYNFGVDIYYTPKERNEEYIVESFDNIRRVTSNNIIERYENSNGDIISKGDLEDKLTELKRLHCEEEEDYNEHWTNLEAEYEYKKLKRDYQPIYRTVYTLSNPIPMEIIGDFTLNTGNPYIKSRFVNHNIISDMYTYERNLAIMNKIEDTLKRYGVEKVDDSKKNEKTYSYGNYIDIKNKLRYIKLGGSYVYNSDYMFTHDTRNGTLEELKRVYNSDMITVEDTIKSKYLNMFGSILEGDNSIILREITTDVEQVRNRLNSLDVKVKGRPEQRLLFNKMNDIINKLYKLYKV